MHRKFYRSLGRGTPGIEKHHQMKKGGIEMCCHSRNVMKTVISAQGAGEIIQLFQYHAVDFSGVL